VRAQIIEWKYIQGMKKEFTLKLYKKKALNGYQEEDWNEIEKEMMKLLLFLSHFIHKQFSFHSSCLFSK
jgi:hypothetical protein